MLHILLLTSAGFKTPVASVWTDLLATIVLTAVGLHFWSARLMRHLNQDWSETKAWQVKTSQIRMLTGWLCLVWLFVIARALSTFK